MVNKNKYEAGNSLPASFSIRYFYTLWITVFLFCLIIPEKAFSQKVTKDYSVMQQESGALYFIYPKDGFRSDHSKSELIFDITHLDSSDSLTFNFTYIDPMLFQIDSLSVQYNDEFYISAPASKIFIEPSKSKWSYRYGAFFAFHDFDRLFDFSQSPEIKLYCGENTISLKMKQNKWKKESQLISRIFDIIRLNREK
jgi:hypothetical protein